MRNVGAIAAVVWLALAAIGLGEPVAPGGAGVPGAGVPVPGVPGVASGQVMRVYHIGNSLTYGVLRPRLSGAFLSVAGEGESSGVKYEFGWHLLWGSSLAKTWVMAEAPSEVTADYGNFRKALAEHRWDAITLQPWTPAEDADEELEAAIRFIKLAVKKSPEVQVYIYETWPPAHRRGGLSFAESWVRPSSAGKREAPIYNRDYCPGLVKALNRKIGKLELKKPVELIPVGTVMYELDRMARAGRVPGLTTMDPLYKDVVHLMPAGNYVALCTFYAVIMKRDPRAAGSFSHKEGMIVTRDYDPTVPPELAAVIEETVWRMTHPPEATTPAPGSHPGSAPGSAAGGHGPRK